MGDDYADDEAISAYANDAVMRMGMDASSLTVGVERGVDEGDEIVTVSVTLPVTSFSGLLETPLLHRQQFTVVTRES
ncbi:MAG: hypothetical protein H6742_07665 [Alphaproteobacteria bacterium]|nr:hypothetical protein [Alphaproteobacteria bacterium]